MTSFMATFMVAALGYFVDVYDLILFGVVRVESLRAIRIPEEQLLDAGILLINTQMVGMLLGGFFWGVLGDKKGRTTVMMASILLYSLANIANAYVFSLNSYAVLRFIAGFGLAGEVGAAVTLVSESAPANRRTLWTALLTAFGLMGAVVASLVADQLHWQMAYWVGGIMGLLLLLLRLRVSESKIFEKSLSHARGRLDFFVRSKERFFRYLACVLIGVPIWYVVGILMTFAPEIQKSLGALETFSAGHAILFCYVGLTFGDLLSGFISHYVKSRRRVLMMSLGVLAVLSVSYLNFAHSNETQFYALCALLGFAGGYWSVYITMVAESFGTNLRATAVITVTNCMRGSVVLTTSGVQFFQQYMTLPQSALLMAAVIFSLGFGSLWYLSDTFGKNLDYQEG